MTGRVRFENTNDRDAAVVGAVGSVAGGALAAASLITGGALGPFPPLYAMATAFFIVFAGLAGRSRRHHSDATAAAYGVGALGWAGVLTGIALTVPSLVVGGAALAFVAGTGAIALGLRGADA
jgi:hypothetical protein